MQVAQQEGAAEAPAAPAPAPNLQWVGPPLYIRNAAPHYRAANVAGQQINIGDFVYLQPSDPTVLLYIGRVEDFLVSNNVMSATITWFYRPSELILDTPLPVFDNEVFASDESETHPLDSVAGRCLVVPPGTPAKQPTGSGRGQFDVYVCSRKYIATEGRVVPFADEQVGNEARPFILVNGRILARPAAGGYLEQQRAPDTAQQAPSRGASKRKKREKTPSTTTASRKRTSPGTNGAAAMVLPAPAATAAPSGSVSQGGRATSEKSGGGVATTTPDAAGTPRANPPPSPRNS